MCESASLSHVIFENDCGLSIIAAVGHSVFVIEIVHNSILNSFMWLAIVIKVAKEMLLPLSSTGC